MNAGVIASRYALALFKYVAANGDHALVCAQAQIIEEALDSLPDFAKVVEDQLALSVSGKKELILSSLGERRAEPVLERFLDLVLQHRREAFLGGMLRNYIALYHKSEDLHFVKLTTAVPVSEALASKVAAAASRELGGRVEVRRSVDPSIIGGLILALDGYRLDASIKGRLEEISKQFTSKNKRIV